MLDVMGDGYGGIDDIVIVAEHFGASGAIYQQMIRERGTQLLEVLDAYQLGEIAKEAKEWDPKLAYYSQFEDVLQSLMKMFANVLAA
ncbi:MAG: hypothetical protein JSV05_09210 [Candidatus Bathyarchaeota archaeon]|nr:MAG: hypothetical protein JSV05_09210 [Candidatus Bathyarchaeota archaeon]